MGSSRWSDDFYQDRKAERAKSGTPDFAYSAKVAAAPTHEQRTHEKLDPKGVKIREARDSVAHPQSLAIGFMLDVTGSMAHLPPLVQQALPALMNTITGTGVTDPQILFGAVGDAYGDKGSLQVGQFESGIEMDEDIRRFWLEGRGGGGPGSMGSCECYQNAIYFFARHTAIDCLEKRKQKGFLFFCGDEMPYDKVNASQIREILGDGLETDISTKDIVKEAQEKFEIFFIVPEGSYHANDAKVPAAWRALLGEAHVLKLGNVSDICETVAGAIGITLGTTTLAKFTESIKDARKATIVKEALTPLATKTNRVGDSKAKPTVARL
jgi:hypothetical protein